MSLAPDRDDCRAVCDGQECPMEAPGSCRRNGGPAGQPANKTSGPMAPASPLVPSRRLPAHGSTRSQQVVRTPRWLIESVSVTWGEIALDAASDDENAVCYCHYTEADNGLDLPWLPAPGYIAWCNPPYSSIGPWVKHAAEQRHETESVLLVLASVGSNWWAEYVDGLSEVIFIRPRITFVGHKDPFPRDLALVHYGPGVIPYYYSAKLVPGVVQAIQRDCRVVHGGVAGSQPAAEK